MSRTIKREVLVSVQLVPDELADMFWECNAEEQAMFFNRLGEIAGSALELQIRNIRASGHLDAQGRDAMVAIA